LILALSVDSLPAQVIDPAPTPTPTPTPIPRVG
jgi:hypothetical protein